MTIFEWCVVLLSFVSVLLIPALGLLIHMAMKWSRVETTQAEMREDLRILIDQKEKVHTEMYHQMSADREATDKRLRWLEENVWNRGRTR